MEHENMGFNGDMGFCQNYDIFSGSWVQSTPQVNLEALNTLPPLGLKLTHSPSFLEKVDQLIETQSYEDHRNYNNYAYYTAARPKPKDGSQQSNKIKSENFPISLLRIGSWQRVSRNEGDLIAKCYFAKRRLVWECLENGLKSKIEIMWGDILSFKASAGEDEIGVLDIELKQCPTFHHEIDPQPRKHTQWRVVDDFTGDQARRIRRHHLEFPPGALDRPLEKLLRCDEQLYQLSRRAFPSLESPYFQTDHEFSIQFGGEGPSSYASPYNNQQLQFSFSNLPAGTPLLTHYPTFEQTAAQQQSLTKKDSDSPIPDAIGNPASLCWVSEMNNVTDSILTKKVLGGRCFSPAANSSALVNPAIPLQSHNYIGTNQLGEMVPTPLNFQMQMHPQQLASLEEPTAYPQPQRYESPVNDFQNMGLDNLQIGNNNVGVAEGNLYREGNFTGGNMNVIADIEQGVTENSMDMNNNRPSNGGRIIYTQNPAYIWKQIQTPMDVQVEVRSHYSSVFSDASTQYPAQLCTGKFC